MEVEHIRTSAEGGRMGLDVSHDCWSGSYSQLARWRRWVAARYGIPLDLMEGYGDITLEPGDVELLDQLGYSKDAHLLREVVRAAVGVTPIPWEAIRQDPVVKLLHHSDCDGRIRWFDAKPIALSLAKAIRGVPDDTKPDSPPRGCYDGMVPATKRFIRGLLAAHRRREDVIFR